MTPINIFGLFCIAIGVGIYAYLCYKEKEIDKKVEKEAK